MNAVLGYVSAADLRMSRRIRCWALPRWLAVWMLVATRVGDGWGWYLLGAALLGGGGPAHRALAEGLVAIAIANVFLVPLKRGVRRPRPAADGQRGFRVRPPDEFSFPSGHATNAFAVCTVMAAAFPVLAPAFGVLAASIALSRVVLGLHYLSDIVAGAALGGAAGLAAVHLVLA